MQSHVVLRFNGNPKIQPALPNDYLRQYT